MAPNRNQSASATCDNCGTRGRETSDDAPNSLGQNAPVFKCPTCHATWTGFPNVGDGVERPDDLLKGRDGYRGDGR